MYIQLPAYNIQTFKQYIPYWMTSAIRTTYDKHKAEITMIYATI